MRVAGAVEGRELGAQLPRVGRHGAQCSVLGCGPSRLTVLARAAPSACISRAIPAAAADRARQDPRSTLLLTRARRRWVTGQSQRM